MTRSSITAILCGIALTASNLAVQSAQPQPVTPLDEHAIARQGCIATGAAGRVRCPDLDDRCEDAINLQQRVCMIEALEALHSSALDKKAPPPGAVQPR